MTEYEELGTILQKAIHKKISRSFFERNLKIREIQMKRKTGERENEQEISYRFGFWNISIWQVTVLCVMLKRNTKIYTLFPITNEILHWIAHMQSTLPNVNLSTHFESVSLYSLLYFFLLLVSIPFTYALIHFYFSSPPSSSFSFISF